MPRSRAHPTGIPQPVRIIDYLCERGHDWTSLREVKNQIGCSPETLASVLSRLRHRGGVDHVTSGGYIKLRWNNPLSYMFTDEHSVRATGRAEGFEP